MKTEHEMKMQELADKLMNRWRKLFAESPDNMPPGARRIIEAENSRVIGPDEKAKTRINRIFAAWRESGLSLADNMARADRCIAELSGLDFSSENASRVADNVLGHA